jgi:Undecaprenyl-phosphate glucose phosphotransferase
MRAEYHERDGLMSPVSEAVGGAAQAPRARTQRRGVVFQVVEPVVAIADAVIIVGSSVIGGAAYQLAASIPIVELETYAGYGLIGSLAYALAAHRFELYRLKGLLLQRRDYVRVAASWLWAVLVVSVVLFLLKRGADVSRGSIISFSFLGGAALLLWRAAVKSWLRQAIDRGLIRGRRIVILGTEEELAIIRPGDLMKLCGFDEVTRVLLPQKDCPEWRQPYIAAVNEALDHARKASAEEIILALPWDNKTQLELVRDRLRLTPLPVRLLPDRSVQSILSYRTWSTQEYLLIEIQRAPLSASERVAKRALDILVAGFALACLLPLMLLVAAAIRLESPGPAIFQQRRKGFNGKDFVIYKFRTMTVMEDGPAIIQARKSDARVTSLGRHFRQTSIDELPQLFNVLRGDMSLVGPRPHALAHDDEYSQLIANYAFRHHMKPGITGWAQVNGFRGGTPQLEQMAKRIELDLWYINNWTLGLDLQILLRTSFDVMRGHNAY